MTPGCTPRDGGLFAGVGFSGRSGPARIRDFRGGGREWEDGKVGNFVAEKRAQRLARGLYYFEFILVLVKFGGYLPLFE